MDFHLEQGYSKTELATLLGVLEDDLRKQRDKMNMSIVIEDRKMKTFETKQLEMNEKVEGFVDRVTSQLEQSNNIIKELSVNIFEVLSFYKELLQVWNSVNEASESMDTSKMNSERGFMSESHQQFQPTPKQELMQDKKFLDMMNKAENLLSRLDFDTEFIDGIVGDNDEVIQKRNKILQGLNDAKKPRFSKTSRQDSNQRSR